uniref:Nonexpresser of PR genes 1 n=1 Tax=Camptotheca acuminata TaxID=16922 RepID=A0A3G2CKC3_CAMAC|nr:nonexpresser of PR genes 1 [Camptotheca acuminata]
MDTRTAFSDSNDISGSSSICCVANTESISPEPSASNIADLKRLSENLASIFESTPDSDFFSDAKIVVAGGREIAVHRCILSARSPFFKNVFCGKERGVKLELKELAKDFDVSFDSLVTVLAYLYSGKVKSLPKDVCACVDEECEHVVCRPAVDFMVEVLYVAYVFQIYELVALYQRHLIEILNKVAADDILVVLSVANMCGKECERLLARCIETIFRSDVDVITLDKLLPQHIVKQIVGYRFELGLHEPESNCFPDKHVKRLHRALESDDVELVRMLLKEGHTTLDDAYALHYAVAYCDAKTTTELLDLALADVNHRNPRGYTVLHVAAMRKEPKIIVSLLTKGARPSDLTSDGRKALQISKRLTRYVDYFKSTEEGKASPKDRLCIEILEQAERRDPLLGEASVSLAMAGDDLRMKLLYLENRVGLAKLLFPMEAKVAMDIAQVDGTSEFSLASINSKNLADAPRTTVDLNEAPFKIKEEHLNRLRALSKTVELGKRFFPRCSEVLNKIMDADELSELAYLGKDTPEERQMKKQRYMDLQEVVSKAFNEDKEEFDRSNISSSSSSTSIGVMRPNGKLTFKK